MGSQITEVSSTFHTLWILIIAVQSVRNLKTRIAYIFKTKQDRGRDTIGKIGANLINE